MADAPHLHVEFFTQAVENPAKSREAGRPIFEDQEMVKIQIVGDPKNTLIAPAHTSPSRDPNTGLPLTYAQKYPEHYRYFKDNADQQQAAGTPLAEVPWLTASRRAELKALKIFTVEGLAGLDGTMLQRIGMGGRELKNQAQAWLDAASGASGTTRLAAELEARDAVIAQLKADIELLKGGATPAEPVATPAAADDGLGDVSPFMAWDDEDIKNWIKDATGARPIGNPSHKTLVARADEINAEMAQSRAA